MDKDKLKTDYQNACNAYVKAFCKKHGFDYSDNFWVADEAGTTACIGDYFIDMQTIISDIDLNAPEDDFLTWYDYCVEMHDFGSENTPNFKSWISGCTRKSEEEIQELRKRHQEIEELKSSFIELLKQQ
jgi:hypothetical protein